MTGSLLDWYAAHARDLPWRSADRTPWGVLVSEVMLQQTQVVRVEPKWRAWMARWPTPADLAAAAGAEVLVAWQGLGYPRRALRLQQTAAVLVAEHNGDVPADEPGLRALPGIGEYTASAVLAFAFAAPVAVLDTNVRRVLARWCTGTAGPVSGGISRAERALALGLLPGADLAPTWSVALMELGALVCTARGPACGECPLASECAWRSAGYPAGPSAGRRQPTFTGSDRQARGFLLREVLARGGDEAPELADRWVKHRHNAAGAEAQARRALTSLLADGLLRHGSGDLVLPGGS